MPSPPNFGFPGFDGGTSVFGFQWNQSGLVTDSSKSTGTQTVAAAGNTVISTETVTQKTGILLTSSSESCSFS